VVAFWLRERRRPVPCPYGARFVLTGPRPFLSRRRLREALAMRPRERVLEIGPGTGYYTLDIARRVGALDVVDVQQEMLDHTLDRATEAGLTNVTATRADATALPFPDGTFHAAYLVTVLGEVPDQEGALRELARVLTPGGRLVVGEALLDPHWVAPAALAVRAARVGLRVERRLGPPFAYFAVLRLAF
jgi:ubiquinone/menaquinone biosynthesis C-methylase UbiE